MRLDRRDAGFRDPRTRTITMLEIAAGSRELLLKIEIRKGVYAALPKCQALDRGQSAGFHRFRRRTK
jgi:hypothetical protein